MTSHDLRPIIRAHLALGLTSWTAVVVIAAGIVYVLLALAPPAFLDLSAESDVRWWFHPLLGWPMIAQGSSALLGASLLVRASRGIALAAGALMLALQIALLALLLAGSGMISIALVGMLGLALTSTSAWVSVALLNDAQRRGLSGGVLRALSPQIYWRDPLSVCGGTVFLAGQLLRLSGLVVVMHVAGAILALVTVVLAGGGGFGDIRLAFVIVGASFLLACVLAVFLFVLGIGLRMVGRWLIRASLAGALRHDPRAPTLFLRAFDEDQVAFAKGAGLLSRMLYGASRLDHILVEHFSRLGPVVAIGRPGSKPPFGASRIYVDDAHWKERVLELSAAARAIVVVVNTSAGLRWEIDTMLTGPFRERVVFLRSPSTSTAPAGSELAELITPGGASAMMPFALYHSSSGDVISLEGATGTAHAYQVGLEVFFAERMESAVKKRAGPVSVICYAAIASLLTASAAVHAEEWRWRMTLSDAALLRAEEFEQPFPIVLAGTNGADTLFARVSGNADRVDVLGALGRYRTSYRVRSYPGSSSVFSSDQSRMVRYNATTLRTELVTFDTGQRLDLGVLPRFRPLDPDCMSWTLGCREEGAQFVFSPDGGALAVRLSERIDIHQREGGVRSLAPGGELVALSRDGSVLITREVVQRPRERSFMSWTLMEERVHRLSVREVETGLIVWEMDVQGRIGGPLGDGLLVESGGKWFYLDLARRAQASALDIPASYAPELSPDGRFVLAAGPERLVRYDPFGGVSSRTFDGEVLLVSTDATRVFARVHNGYAVVPIEEDAAAIPVDVPVDIYSRDGDVVTLVHDGRRRLLDLRDGALSAPQSGANDSSAIEEGPGPRFGAELFGNYFVFEKDASAPPRGDLVSSVCAAGEVPAFSQADRARLAPLRGRPWNVCDWRGLYSAEGRAQFIRLLHIRFLGARDYVCGETEARGTRDANALARCERRAPDRQLRDAHELD